MLFVAPLAANERIAHHFAVTKSRAQVEGQVITWVDVGTTLQVHSKTKQNDSFLALMLYIAIGGKSRICYWR